MTTKSPGKPRAKAAKKTPVPDRPRLKITDEQIAFVREVICQSQPPAMDLSKLLPFKDGGTDGDDPRGDAGCMARAIHQFLSYRDTRGWRDWSAAAARGDWS